MGVSALTVQLETAKPNEALRRIGQALTKVHHPAGVVCFASGTLASCLQALAEGARQQFSGLPCLFASSDGVSTEQGELQDQDGLVCLLLGGKRLGIAVSGAAFGRMSDLYPPSMEGGASNHGPQMVLASCRSGSPAREPGRSGQGIGEEDGWFGAITSSEGRLWGIDADSNAASGLTAIVEFRGAEAPLLTVSPCCRFISEPLTVSAAEGNVVVELDGVPALVALGQATAKLVDRSWIVCGILEDARAQPEPGMPGVIYRPLRGIDPSRGAVLLTEPVLPGTRIAFAVRDDRAARRALEDGLRITKQRLCGASPRFGIYFDGLGRGRSLYGAPNVDLGVIRHILGDFPILGMRTAFELRSEQGQPCAQTLTGQLALFSNPS